MELIWDVIVMGKVSVDFFFVLRDICNTLFSNEMQIRCKITDYIYMTKRMATIIDSKD